MNVIQLANGLELKNVKEVVQYANTQYVALQLLDQKNKDLEAKVKHLEEMLEVTQRVDVLIKTPEQCIVENQINRIQETANARQLTNEEIKSLDILIKNKLLLNGEATQVNGEVKPKKKVTQAQLIQIAKQEK